MAVGGSSNDTLNESFAEVRVIVSVVYIDQFSHFMVSDFGGKF